VKKETIRDDDLCKPLGRGAEKGSKDTRRYETFKIPCSTTPNNGSEKGSRGKDKNRSPTKVHGSGNPDEVLEEIRILKLY